MRYKCERKGEKETLMKRKQETKENEIKERDNEGVNNAEKQEENETQL